MTFVLVGAAKSTKSAVERNLPHVVDTGMNPRPEMPPTWPPRVLDVGYRPGNLSSKQ